MKVSQAVIGCILFTLASLASTGFAEGKMAYLEGDYKTAMAEWRPIAEQGSAIAQSNLGAMYEQGLGMP